MKQDQISIIDEPLIPGLCFRHFRGESDLPHIAAVLTASEKADKIERQVTSQNIASAFQHLINCDPFHDLIIAEINSGAVGYARGWWEDEAFDERLYKISGFVIPEWRRRGIGRAMLTWVENHLRANAKLHPTERTQFFQVNKDYFQEGKAKLLESVGYQPVRYFYAMVRSNLDDIPEWPLPAGLSIRPVSAEQYPVIWKSVVETSQDEWGYTPPSDEDYQEWLNHPHFQPSLWQIAWDTASEQPVGHVLTYIHEEENQQFKRARGYTEGIGVVRAWRNRGLAKALIGRSLRAQKEVGMTESALVVDTDSQSNATRLYEGCGFQVVGCSTIYRKPLDSIK
jgi:GNAT superfamily N-acetyltransferase